MEALAYLFMAMPFVVAIFLAVIAVLALVLCYSNFAAGVWVVVLFSMLDSITTNTPVLHLGLALFPGDLMSLLLTPVVLLRLLIAPRATPLNKAWVAFAVAVLVSLVTGLLSFGTTAGVQSRDYYYFVLVATYAMTFTPDERTPTALLRPFCWMGGILLLLTAYRWVVYYTPIPSLLPPGGTYNIDGAIRVVYSTDALILGELLIGALYFSSCAAPLKRMRLLMPMLFAFVLVLQHRSVWAAVLVGALTPVLIGKNAASAAKQLGVFILMLTLVVAPFALSGSGGGGIGTQLESSATNALQVKGSAGERWRSWGAMIEKWKANGARSILIGNSFGSDHSRYVIDDEGKQRKLEYFAHNMYVQTLFNTGLVGLLGIVGAMFVILSELSRIARQDPDNVWVRFIFAMNLMLVFYFIPYGLSFPQALFLGVGLNLVMLHRSVSQKRIFSPVRI